ncbi:MAG: hypothetical protein AB7E72_15010 [Lysobacterales bacterium]
MMALVPFLVLPFSALVAILAIVLLLRGEELDDSSLMLSFGSLFATCVILSYGLLQTQWLQFKLDPRLEQVAILKAHPVFQALELSPDRHRPLMEALLGDVAQGAPVQDALDQALPALAAITRERMGFAGADAKVAWGKAELQALREFQRLDLVRCADLADSQGNRQGLRTLGSELSGETRAELEQAMVAVMKSADVGLRDRYAYAAESVEFSQFQKRYSELRQPLVRRYGEQVFRHLESNQMRKAAPFDDKKLLCNARIDQLDAALAEPAPMAAMLIGAMLR